MIHEPHRDMAGAKRYEELEAWQLADELKREVYALTDTGPASKDFTFRSQIRDSAASNSKNVATKLIVYLKAEAKRRARKKRRSRSRNDEPRTSNDER